MKLTLRTLSLSSFALALVSSAASAQTGSYTIIDPGAGNTLTITSDTQINGALNVTGNLLQLGNAPAPASQPAAAFKYTDDPTGNGAKLEFQAARPSVTWVWEANTSAGWKPRMALDVNNVLNLYAPYDAANPGNSSNPAITISPGSASAAPTITIGGQAVATAATLASGYVPLVSNGLSVIANGFVGIGPTISVQPPVQPLDVRGNAQISGNLAVGSTPVYDNQGLRVLFFQGTTGTSWGAAITNYNYDVSDPGKRVIGADISGATYYSGNADTIIGVFAAGQVLSAGHVNTAIGGNFIVENWGGASASLGDAIGVRIQAPLNDGGGTIANAYNLYIEQPTKAQNNFAIYSAGGTNYFGGNVGIKTTAPQAALHVNGASRFDGRVRIAPQGDISMGAFTSEP